MIRSELREKVIITRLSGGLGNQLFQYAFARSLAIKHGAELKLDLSSYGASSQGVTLRRYELAQFRIQAKVAKCSEIWYLQKEGRAGKLFVLLGSRFSRCPLRRVKESGFAYCPELSGLPDNVYLDGYWQSERYFKENAELIRHDLQFSNAPAAADREVEREIQAGDSIAVHVRRGDFVSDSTISAVHGVCSRDYYYRAITLIANKLRNPRLFVFSDDPTWVKENLRTGLHAVYVTHNTENTAVQDFRLMSLCDHQVISNSTFSWWAAWLNANPAKTVVAPARWFASGKFDTRDLLPADWVKL